MSKEVERKFLIREGKIDHLTNALLQIYSSVDGLRANVLRYGETIRQGYLPVYLGLELADELGVDVEFSLEEARLRDKAGRFYFTLKGEGGLSRSELEEEIYRDVFGQYWPLTEGRRVEKVRLSVPFEGHTAEIDVYTDRNLIVAEVEVPTIEDAGILSALGKDITSEKKYKNKNLAK